jgi:perosamine synthetase
VFAFYPNKQMSTGEGGVVTTHSEEEWRVLCSLRNQGRSYDGGGGWFHHVRVGLNYRWTDIQAAIGLGQLEKLDRILELRGRAAARYDELLAAVDGVETPAADDEDRRRSWFVYVIKLDASIDRDAVMAAMRADGIATAEYVPCIHLQPYMRKEYGFAEGLCPVAEETASRTLALPFFTQIDAGDQERVVDVLRSAVSA